MPKWSEVPEDQEWQVVFTDPDFINPHHHEVEPLYPAPPAQRWRHKKRGSTYRLVSIEYAAASAAETDSSLTHATTWCAVGGFHARVKGIIDAGARVVFYLADVDDTPWARSHHEFFDGRFEPVEEPAGRSDKTVALVAELGNLGDLIARGQLTQPRTVGRRIKAIAAGLRREA